MLSLLQKAKTLKELMSLTESLKSGQLKLVEKAKTLKRVMELVELLGLGVRLPVEAGHGLAVVAHPLVEFVPVLARVGNALAPLFGQLVGFGRVTVRRRNVHGSDFHGVGVVVVFVCRFLGVAGYLFVRVPAPAHHAVARGVPAVGHDHPVGQGEVVALHHRDAPRVTSARWLDPNNPDAFGESLWLCRLECRTWPLACRQTHFHIAGIAWFAWHAARLCSCRDSAGGAIRALLLTCASLLRLPLQQPAHCPSAYQSFHDVMHGLTQAGSQGCQSGCWPGFRLCGGCDGLLALGR